MRFVTVRELRSQSADLWRSLPDEGDVVITSNGKPVAILLPVAAANLEQSLAALRRVRAMTALETMQKQSVAAGLDQWTAEQVEAEIAAARKGRKR